MDREAGFSRILAALVIGLAVSVVAVLLFNLWLGQTDLRPEPETSSTTIAPGPPVEVVPLGVELTADGEIRLYVPRCPDTQVTSVGWLYFPNLNTLWAIDLEDDSQATYEFTVGVAPPGFSTAIDLDRPVDEAPDDVEMSFMAERSTDAGESLPPAFANVRLDELTVGSIQYSGNGEPPGVAHSIEEFESAVGCEAS